MRNSTFLKMIIGILLFMQASAASAYTEPLQLKLTSMCSDNPDETRRWRVRNPSNSDVLIEWEVYGTSQRGTLFAPSGDSYFYTNTVPGPNTTKIYWVDNGIVKSTTKASGGAKCQPDCNVPGANLIENGDFDEGISILDLKNGENDISQFGSFSPYYDQTRWPGSTPWPAIGREMLPEGTIAIDNNPNAYHPTFDKSCMKDDANFDHTSVKSGGNMLIVNGANNTGKVTQGKGIITTNDHLINEPLWVSNTFEVEQGKYYTLKLLARSVVASNGASLRFKILNDAPQYTALSVLGEFTEPMELSKGQLCGWNAYDDTWVASTSGKVRVAIYNNELALGGNDFAIDDISLTACGGIEGPVPCGIYFKTAAGFTPVIKGDAPGQYVLNPDGGTYVGEAEFITMSGDVWIEGQLYPSSSDMGQLIKVDCSPCDVYYIDNDADQIYLVTPDLQAGKAILTPVFSLRDARGHNNRPFGDAHIALNVADADNYLGIESGSRLYVFQSGNRREFGYFDTDDKEWHYMGRMNNGDMHIEGGVVQASFDPHGRLFITSTESNELHMVKNVCSDDFNAMEIVDFGKIKILDPSTAYASGTPYDALEDLGNINIQGADIAFDQDGSFYLATHNRKSVYSVSGYENFMFSTLVGQTKPRVTGLAVLSNGRGELIYSARDQRVMTIISKKDGSEIAELDMELPDGTSFKSAWGDMSSACIEYVPTCTDYAMSVQNYSAGTLASLNPESEPISVRMQEGKSLDWPEVQDGKIDFVSLGYSGIGANYPAPAEPDASAIAAGMVAERGFIELELTSKLYNWNKNGVLVGSGNSREKAFGGDGISKADLIVVETSWGKMNTNCGKDMNRNYPERAMFYGSPNGEDWAYLGYGCRTTFIDIEPALLEKGWEYIKYLRVVDFTDPEKFPNNADGYDVNGVIYCPKNVFQAITGVDGSTLYANARQAADTPVFDWDAFTSTPDVVDMLGNEVVDLDRSINIYPNPSDDFVNIDVTLQSEGAIQVDVYDATGRLVYSREGETTFSDRVNFAEFGAGLYLARVSAAGETKTMKFIITR